MQSVRQEKSMDDTGCRMTEPGKPPSPSRIEEWIGKDADALWKRVTHMIENNYPDVFSPEWLFGGKKYGWSLRYKKGKSFCTLIPEKNRFALLIVFGAEERKKVEAIRHELSPEPENITMKLRHIMMESGCFSSYMMTVWLLTWGGFLL